MIVYVKPPCGYKSGIVCDMSLFQYTYIDDLSNEVVENLLF